MRTTPRPSTRATRPHLTPCASSRQDNGPPTSPLPTPSTGAQSSANYQKTTGQHTRTHAPPRPSSVTSHTPRTTSRPPRATSITQRPHRRPPLHTAADPRTHTAVHPSTHSPLHPAPTRHTPPKRSSHAPHPGAHSQYANPLPHGSQHTTRAPRCRQCITQPLAQTRTRFWNFFDSHTHP